MKNQAEKAVSEARQVCEVAQEELDSALAQGKNAAAARKRLALAQEELARVEALAAEEARRAEENHRAGIEQEAKAMVASRLREIEDEVGGFARVGTPSIGLPTGIAAALLAKEHEHSTAAGAYQAAQEQVTELENRRQALQTERADIVARRSRGDHHSDDGQRLELLAADLEGLNDLIRRQAAKLPASPDSLEAEVHHRRNQWEKAYREARTKALLEVAQELESKLIAVADHLAAINPGGDVNSRWQPSLTLRHGVQLSVWSGSRLGARHG